MNGHYLKESTLYGAVTLILARHFSCLQNSLFKDNVQVFLVNYRHERLSVTLSISPSVADSLYLSCSPSGYFSLSISFSHFLSVAFWLSFCCFLCPSVTFYVCCSLSVALSLSLSLFLSLALSVILSFSMYLSLALFLCLSICHSLFPPLLLSPKFKFQIALLAWYFVHIAKALQDRKRNRLINKSKSKNIFLYIHKK